MPKIDRAHKVVFHPERKRIQGRYFMAPKLFNKVVCFVLAAMLEGILLPSNKAAKTGVCLYLVKCNDSYAQMCCKRYYVIFSTFSLTFKCKICVQKEVIHNFKKNILFS